MADDQRNDIERNDASAADEQLQQRLTPLRQRIDEIDRDLVRLMNERARVAVDIGLAKKSISGQSAAYYVPSREKAVLDKIRQLNEGPLPDRSLDAVWREIMSGSVRLQTPMRIAYLGPAGSFSHAAARAKFGSSVDYLPGERIESVFTAVCAGLAEHGIVPVENSAHGSVGETFDAFATHTPEICGEVLLAVHHHVMCTGPWEQVKVVTSKPEVFSQCRRWLESAARGKEIRPAASSSAAVQEARGDSTVAAIGSRLASEVYDVPIQFDHVEDQSQNVTRFWILRRPSDATAAAWQEDGEAWRTTVVFNTTDRAGALVEVLDAFRTAGINLTHLEKRPSGQAGWQYVFFIDAAGHRGSPAMGRAIEEARQHCRDLKVLGTYAQAVEVA